MPLETLDQDAQVGRQVARLHARQGQDLQGDDNDHPH
jgi:hypothetical protein